MQRDPELVEQHFEQECRSQVADWMRRAAERLAPTGTPLYVTGGNDDYLSIEGVLDDAAWITNAEGHVLELTAGVPMISTGYGNPTPWHCPRDVSEDDLAERIRQMADTLIPRPAEIRVIVNGVDTDRYRPRHANGALRAEFGLDARTPVIGSIGRLDAIKAYGTTLVHLRFAIATLAYGFPSRWIRPGRSSSKVRS